MKRSIGILISLCASFLFTSCIGIPQGVNPVESFKSDKYLGTWYEIARLDYRFEKGLSHVTANYSLRKDGGIRVSNRGYSDAGHKWKESVGKAYFVNRQDQGYLKVSFYGPFYASYVVIDVDENYQHALVCGSDKSYLWILSRSPHMSDDTKAMLMAKATAHGFDASKLIFVNQD